MSESSSIPGKSTAPIRRKNTETGQTMHTPSARSTDEILRKHVKSDAPTMAHRAPIAEKV